MTEQTTKFEHLEINGAVLETIQNHAVATFMSEGIMQHTDGNMKDILPILLHIVMHLSQYKIIDHDPEELIGALLSAYKEVEKLSAMAQGVGETKQ